MKTQELQKVLETLMVITNEEVEELDLTTANFGRQYYINMLCRNLRCISDTLSIRKESNTYVIDYEHEGINLVVGTVTFKTKQNKGTYTARGRYGDIYREYKYATGVSVAVEQMYGVIDDSIIERWTRLKEYRAEEIARMDTVKTDAENARKLLEEHGYDVDKIKEWL